LKENWAASMTLRTVLLSLQVLLAVPVPDDPQDAVVASMFKKNKEQYIQKAKEWTVQYAGENGTFVKSEMHGYISVYGVNCRIYVFV